MRNYIHRPSFPTLLRYVVHAIVDPMMRLMFGDSLFQPPHFLCSVNEETKGTNGPLQPCSLTDSIVRGSFKHEDAQIHHCR